MSQVLDTDEYLDSLFSENLDTSDTFDLFNSTQLYFETLETSVYPFLDTSDTFDLFNSLCPERPETSVYPFLDTNNYTAKECLALVEQEPKNICHLTVQQRNNNLRKIAVSKNPEVLQALGLEEQNARIAFLAVQKDAYAILWIREDLITNRIVVAAIKQNPSIIEYLNPIYFSRTVSSLICRKYKNYRDYVPRKYVFNYFIKPIETMKSKIVNQELKFHSYKV